MLARRRALAKAHRQLGAEAESPDAPGRRPDHRFVQHHRNDPAMHDSLKAGVITAGSEFGAHDAGLLINFEVQLQTVRIVSAAHKAPGSMWKLKHGRRTLHDMVTSFIRRSDGSV